MNSVTLGRIRAAAQHNGVQLLKARQTGGEIAGLYRAARRIVARIEVEHHPLPCEVGQRHLATVLVRQPEVRRLTPHSQICLAHVYWMQQLAIGFK